METTWRPPEDLRIFLVDDNPDDRALAARALRKDLPRCQISEAGTRREFEALFERGEFDVVITDYQLRWSDGLWVLRQLLVAHPSVPVVMFTNTGSEEVCAEAMRSGLSDYLIKKPKHYVKLPHAVRSSLERYAMRRLVEEQHERERAARQEAVEANRLKDEFLAAVSHELRTPLNAMMGWADLLHAGRLSAEQAGTAIAAIRRNARAQARLIEDLLDMSRIASGQFRLDVQPVRPRQVVLEAVELVRPTALAREIEIRTVLDSQDTVVRGDPQRLLQVLVNLLDNAIKFTPAGGRVSVTLERVNSHIEVSVQDNGRGIGPDVLPHVFERFRQEDGSSTRREGGLGLGLTLAKHLIELQGGAIRAKSPGVDQGSTFVVCMPVSPVDSVPPVARPSEPVEAEAADLDLSGVEILAVDDDADAGEVIRLLLEDAGAQVRVCTSADEALSLLERWTPDVIVSDIGLPDRDGYALIREVRARASTRVVPAVALTAFARRDDQRRALRSGFQAHLAKPVERVDLLTVVGSLVHRHPGG